MREIVPISRIAPSVRTWPGNDLCDCAIDIAAWQRTSLLPGVATFCALLSLQFTSIRPG